MKRSIAILLACVMILSLSACRRDAYTTQRVSNRRLQALRRDYPYAISYDRESFHEHFDQIGADAAFDAVAVVEHRENYGVCRVERVLYGDQYLERRAVSLSLNFRAFPSGRYILFLRNDSVIAEDSMGEIPEDLFREGDQPGILGSFDVDLNLSYFLTDQDVVLSLSDDPGVDECSGLSLEAFAQRLGEVTDIPTIIEMAPPLYALSTLEQAMADPENYVFTGVVTDKSPQSYPYPSAEEPSWLYRVLIVEVRDCWSAPEETLPGASLHFRERGGQTADLRYVVPTQEPLYVGDEVLILGKQDQFLTPYSVLRVEDGRVKVPQEMIGDLELDSGRPYGPVEVELGVLKDLLTRKVQRAGWFPPEDEEE